jgi:hypothetical protein
VTETLTDGVRVNASDCFLAAVQRLRKVGAAKADDAALMAGFCSQDLQVLVGAVSPQLVWEGAQKAGMKTRELVALCASPADVQALMWK